MSGTICRTLCRRYRFLLLCVLGFFLPAGCVSSRIDPGEPVKLSVESDGSVRIRGNPATLKEVPETLESLGVTRNTLIIVVGRRNAPLSVMKELHNELVRSRFPKVVLRKPLEASVSKE